MEQSAREMGFKGGLSKWTATGTVHLLHVATHTRVLSHKPAEFQPVKPECNQKGKQLQNSNKNANTDKAK